MPKVNYIIGIGRSGTSLLMSLLGSHPSIHTPPENYFSVFFAKAFSTKKSFTVKEIELINRFNIAFGKLQPYVGFEYQIPEKILKQGFDGTYLELCKIIYSSFKHIPFPVKNPDIFIDKNPSNTLFLKKLNHFNPGAKYILMIRDYRGNLLSRKESIHLLSPKIAFNAIRWNYYTRKALSWKQKYPSQVCVVRYEDLVENTDECLKTVFSFLEVDPIFSEELREQERAGYANYKDDPDIEKSQRAKKKYEDLSKPIFKNRIDSWKESLSKNEISIADVFCQSSGSEFNYLENYKIGYLRRIQIRLQYTFVFLKVKMGFNKDYLFYHLPIEFKVWKFENYVNSVNKKRVVKK
ncbi:MAG: sulfotransferase family protein [Bacteroidota bacterium]